MPTADHLAAYRAALTPSETTRTRVSHLLRYTERVRLDVDHDEERHHEIPWPVIADILETLRSYAESGE